MNRGDGSLRVSAASEAHSVWEQTNVMSSMRKNSKTNSMKSSTKSVMTMNENSAKKILR